MGNQYNQVIIRVTQILEYSFLITVLHLKMSLSETLQQNQLAVTFKIISKS